MRMSVVASHTHTHTHTKTRTRKHIQSRVWGLMRAQIACVVIGRSTSAFPHE
jgi:hypothetical protein